MNVSQLTAHSSQLTAHAARTAHSSGSQLTARSQLTLIM